MMRISVAVCTYNGAAFVGEQLASIAAQTRPPDEIVIRDDVSQDATRSILEGFAASASVPVRVHINPVNLRSTRNFEGAIRMCGGDVIALADQDDVWKPDKLAVIERAFAQSPEVGLVFSDADIIDGDGQSQGYTLWESVRFFPSQQAQVRAGDTLPVLLKHPVVTGAACAFRASYRESFLPIPPLWIHDEWIAFIIALQARLLPISERLISYRVHSANQIGAESTATTARMRSALGIDPAVYLKYAEQLTLLRDHVGRVLPGHDDFLRRVEAKIRFLRVRGSLPRSRWRRALPIARELVSGGYSRYSNSPLNALRDLLLR